MRADAASDVHPPRGMTTARMIHIDGGEIYAPEPLGRRQVLVCDSKVLRVGDVDRAALDRLDVEYDVIDARGGYVTPGLIDPHQHFLGSSGEGGFQYQTPPLQVSEIVRAGVTTAVGTLGVDTTMQNIAALLGRAKALSNDGLTTCIWSGGYNVPPSTIMSSIREDVMFIDEVIGAGEVAVSDERGLNQSAQELAKMVRDTNVGGHLTGKAGVTHFHVGEEDTRLGPLFDLIEEFRVKPEWLYPTHVERTEKLLDEAIALVHQGATVDMDVVDRKLGKWVRYYLENGGRPDRLTVSSDADSSTPDIYWNQLCELVVKLGMPLEQVLAFATTNVARVLKLAPKGRIAEGCDADLLVLGAGTLEMREVIARGRRMVVGGEPVVREAFLEKSSRRWHLVGDKAPEG